MAMLSGLFRLLLPLAVAALVIGLLASTWVGVLTAAAILLAAVRHEPRLRWFAYLIRGRRALLAIAWGAGAAAQYAAVSAFDFGRGDGLSYLGGTLVLALVSLGCGYWIGKIFEGKVMRSVFLLVPESEQAALAQQLDDLDEAVAGAEGQAADLSGLDPDAVIQAIETRVIGQDPIVAAVVKQAFRRARLKTPNKPIGVELFVGATGAGKTELAKSLADEIFHGNLIRIDCNELSESQNVQRLIGPPPGYQGADQGGQLCRDLARTGTGVLLLDEVEKSHPAALKVLMNLLDEARLTEQSTGRVYSARGFLIVLTSNAARDEIAQVARTETDPVLRETKVKDTLAAAGFLPEILARIDAVYPFAPLASRDVARIIERFLVGFADRVGVELVSADSALLLDLVTRAQKTRTYGVREVVRSVENAVVDGMLNAKDAGQKRVAIHVRDGIVRVEPAPAAVAGVTRSAHA